MTPYLVAAPEDLPVPLSALKAHLSVAHGDDDATIGALQAGIVAALDGWGGLLGRCIMPQTWAVDVTGPGPHLLPFPDASEITANGEPVEAMRRAAGLYVMVEGAAPDEEVTLQAVYGLPPERLPTAQSLIKHMVAREFDAPEGAAYDALTRTINMHLDALRWRRL